MGGFNFGSFFSSVVDTLPVVGEVFGHGFRPFQWAFGQPQLVSVAAFIPTTNNSSATTNQEQIIDNNGTVLALTTYFFDAVFREDHSLRLVSTNHPVQNGAAISDHAYLIPAQVTMEIGFSDSMDSYVTNQYAGYATKSVGAYAVFTNLQQLRVPITLTTRLAVYENMVLEEIRVHQDQTSFHGLRATLLFKQIFLGNVDKNTLSARTNQSTTTRPGASSVFPVPESAIKFGKQVGGVEDWGTNP